ncbi:GntR family transcriptional regulator [Priestia endophytica]|jgi:GntR family transcriptional regulator|uniref:GntR family transcriptional regulator n=1 Tax=Priestia endophytica DSM 13796 TaxID=1121089 RepID=A0A1I6AHR0_9BACI|nr:GntR family transcriptional regulator [Priestia endophytica]KAB2493266.1 GntR family transcriptional regulator [Priestia endophytica]KYG27494.1 GntR family transcriptional regulator [Priestia endophytica]MBG9814363.1 GntR family transcriptional regulator [Priestia endophytica]RAS80122.1 GntR family transcriptional regulator [Priestia endophytica]RAS86935.1 GntR family transcriptional regulator [Priestia endophytica]
MRILISNHSKEPIYEQITKQIREAIMTHEIAQGENLPSIRQLAKDLRVSVITTKRAYEELEKEGLIYSIVGKGSFVAEQNPELLREKKLRAIEEHLLEAIENSRGTDITLAQLKEILELLYEEEK